MHQPAALLEPGIGRRPWHPDVPGRLGLCLVRQRSDLVGRKGVAQRLARPVHQQDALGVDLRVAVEQRYDAARVGFDEDRAGWQRW